MFDFLKRKTKNEINQALPKQVLESVDPAYSGMVRCDEGVCSKRDDVKFLFDKGDEVVLCGHGKIRGPGKIVAREIMMAPYGGFSPMYRVDDGKGHVSYRRQNELACRPETDEAE